MCWSNKAIVFLNSGFKLLTSVLYARIVNGAQTWGICVCSNQPYPGIFNLSFLYVCMVNTIYLLSFVETPRKFINAIINLRGVSTKLNKHI